LLGAGSNGETPAPARHAVSQALKVDFIFSPVGNRMKWCAFEEGRFRELSLFCFRTQCRDIDMFYVYPRASYF
jgi:hypothetical protein